MAQGNKTNQGSIKLTRHIRILRHGASEIGERFVQLRIDGGDGKRTTLVRIDRLGVDFFERLNRLGAHVITDQAHREFLNRIQAEGPQAPSFMVATKLGWYGCQFAFPDGVIAGEEKPIRVYSGPSKRTSGPSTAVAGVSRA